MHEPPAARPRPGLTPVAAAVIVGAVGATAALGAVATAPAVESRWYRRLDKPPWQPPDAAFGPVWSVLYALIAAAMLAVRGRAGDRDPATFALFGTNLALNLGWTLIFFRGRAPRAAAVESLVLEGSTIALILRVRPHSRAAALALVPYAAWVAFATALTFSVARRNS